MKECLFRTSLAGGLASLLSILGAMTAGGWSHSYGYLFTCTAFSILASALIGILCGLSRRTAALSLPLWAATWALPDLWQIGPGQGITQELATALFDVTVSSAGLYMLFRFVRPDSGIAIVAAGGAAVWARSIYPEAALSTALPPSLALIFCSLALAVLGNSLRHVRPAWASPGILAAGLVLLTTLLSAQAQPGNSAALGTDGTRSSGSPSVVLIVLDTVRADHLSPYGYSRDTTPLLARLVAGRGATVYPHAFSHASWTVPAHASLLTGLLPSEHGALVPDSKGGQQPFRLRAGTATLADRLRSAGYRTIGITANPWLLWTGGLRQGFDIFFQPAPARALPLPGESLRHLLVPGLHPEALHQYPTAENVSWQIAEQLDGCKAGPCFLLVNYLDAHSPYVPAEPCRGRFAPWSLREPIGEALIRHPPELLSRLEAHYDEELCTLDLAVADLVRLLDRRGLLDSSWLFITSDHGESFGEHGVNEHGTSLYNEQTRVPLIVFPPKGARLAPASGPVGLVDVAATIAAIGGTRLAGRGRDLRKEADSTTPVQIEFYPDRPKAGFFGALAAEPARAVVVDRYKLIEHAGRRELYDLDTDPRETRDLTALHPDLAKRLSGFLPRLHLRPDDRLGSPSRLTEEQQRQLKSLGYIR